MLPMFLASLLMHGLMGPAGVAVLVALVTMCMRE
jgi:hypothetical protein